MKESMNEDAWKQLDRSMEVGGQNIICVVGPFLSGKTTLAREWLRERYGQVDPYYLNVNQYLLEHLQREGPLAELDRVKAKARLVMQVYLEDAIRQAFQKQHLLVLDAIEILLPYELDLVTLVGKYARGEKRCILCVPEDAEHHFQFKFDWDACQVIRIDR